METKSVVSLTIFIFICICFVRCQKNLPKFRPFHGLRIKTTYLRLNLSSMTPCCMACTSDKLCKSVNYDQKCACELNLVSPDSTAADLVEDNEWTLSFTENHWWTTVLRGTAGIGISIEATFLGGKYRHLTKARAWVLLQKHHQMQYPLQESSVGQLARLKLSNREDNTVRRFYLDKLHDGCPRDMGWWMVVETNGPRYCQYDINISYPTFVYIAGLTAAIWEPVALMQMYL